MRMAMIEFRDTDVLIWILQKKIGLLQLGFAFCPYSLVTTLRQK